jgi:hypothetical protein
MNKNHIAQTAIEAIFPNGKRKKVSVSVGAPYRSKGSWWSESKITGLNESPMSIAGNDSMQALTLALKGIVFRLEGIRKAQDIRYVWPGGDKEYDLRRFLLDPGNDGRSGTNG